MMKKIFIVVLLSVFFLSGCVSTGGYRASSVFDSYFDAPRKVAVMPPDIKIYQLTAGGVDELIDEWSNEAESKALKAIEREMKTLPYIEMSLLDENKLSEADKDFLKEETGLYLAVASSIVWHTYSPDFVFKHKVKNFNYTMGSEISRLGDISGSDTLLFCMGRNYIWSAGRTALACFGLLAGAVSGVCCLPTSGPEFVVVSLIDTKSGNVIWFNYMPAQGDLRKEAVCAKSANKLFKSLHKDKLKR